MRLDLPANEKRVAANQLLSSWNAEFGAPPAYLQEIAEGRDAEWIERKAKLFECGEYCDRGVSVSPSDLQRLASCFDSPVPILIEHTETPLRLGYLTDVEAIGPELFGTLALTKEANDLIEESGAKALSLSVSKSLERIHEVSIVSNPRVESARLFCANFRDCEPISEWKREALSLRNRLNNDEIERSVAQFGLSPAMRNRAIELLRCAKDQRTKECALALLAAIPKTVHFGEIAPSGPVSSHDFPPRKRNSTRSISRALTQVTSQTAGARTRRSGRRASAQNVCRGPGARPRRTGLRRPLVLQWSASHVSWRNLF